MYFYIAYIVLVSFLKLIILCNDICTVYLSEYVLSVFHLSSLPQVAIEVDELNLADGARMDTFFSVKGQDAMAKLSVRSNCIRLY